MADEKAVSKSGLSYLWSKLKVILEGKAEKEHKHNYSDINDPPDIPQIAIVTWTTDDMT